jgi:hypothetical protein
LNGVWRRSRPAPCRVREMLESLTPAGQQPPRLGVVDQLPSPVCFGLCRPTILIPPSYCRPGQDEAVRSVLAHELTHLCRRDAWTCLLISLSQSVYFYVPWFWWLRRQLRLAQEFIADAAAAGVISAVDYAQYLVNLSIGGRPRSVAAARANGIFPIPSDLSRRVEMLLTTPSQLESCAPRRWSLAAASLFLVVATLASGVKLHADDSGNGVAPMPRDDRDPESVQTWQVRVLTVADDENPAGQKVWVFSAEDQQNLERLQKALESLKAAAKRLGDDVPPEVQKQLRDVERQLEELRQRIKKRGSETKKGLDADAARNLAEAAVQKARLEGELARKRSEDLAARAKAEAQKAAEAARKRSADEAAAKAAGSPDAQRQLDQGERDAERLQAEIKRRLQRVAEMENDDWRLAELEAIQALTLKLRAAKADLKAKQDELRKRGEDKEKPADDAKAKALVMEKSRAADAVKRMTEERLMRVPFVSRPTTSTAVARLGIRVEPAPPVLAAQLKLEEGAGLVIVEVRPDSPAKGKLQQFDVLLETNGEQVKANVADLARKVNQIKPGQALVFRVLRSGRRITVDGIAMPEAKESDSKSDGSFRWMEVPRGAILLKDGKAVELENLTDQLFKLDSQKLNINLRLDELDRFKDQLKVLESENFKIELKAGDIDKLSDQLKNVQRDLFKESSAGWKELQEKLNSMKLDLDLEQLDKMHGRIKVIVPELEQFKDLGADKPLRLEIELKGDGPPKIKRLEMPGPAAPKPPLAPAAPPKPGAAAEQIHVIEAVADTRTNSLVKRVRDKDGKENIDIEVITDRPAEDVLKEHKIESPAPVQLPRVPSVPVPVVAPIPDGANVSVSISRSNDDIKIRQQIDNETIIIQAKIKNGLPEVQSITIDDGTRKDGKKAVKTYKSLDEIEGPQRQTIEKLIEKVKGGDGPLAK